MHLTTWRPSFLGRAFQTGIELQIGVFLRIRELTIARSIVSIDQVIKTCNQERHLSQYWSLSICTLKREKKEEKDNNKKKAEEEGSISTLIDCNGRCKMEE